MKLCECGCGEPAPIARRNDRRTGAVRGLPQRFVRGHQGRFTPEQEAEMWRTEDRGYATPCRVWLGAKDGGGYGVRGKSRSGTRRKLHREAWERAYGPIPAGLSVLHRCDVPACAEPSHLFLGTQAENVADCIAKGRASPPPVLRGEANGNYRHGRVASEGVRA